MKTNLKITYTLEDKDFKLLELTMIEKKLSYRVIQKKCNNRYSPTFIFEVFKGKKNMTKEFYETIVVGILGLTLREV